MTIGRHTARPFAVALLVLSCALFASSSATGQSTPNTVVAGGGGTVSAGAFTLHSTIGEPAAGTVSNGSLVLHSGFQATFVAPLGDGRIFYDGFED